MAIITPDGITSTSLNEYVILLGDAFKQVFGSNLDLSPQTAQAQIIGIFALNLSIIDDQIVSAFQQLNIFSANGNQLDGFGATFGIARVQASRSSVNAELGGVPGSIIPVGSQGRTVNNDIFTLSSAVTLDGSGQGTGFFEADVTGPIPIDANTLTSVVSVVAGWETINNSAAGIEGVNKESDFSYRNTYFSTLAKNALNTIESISSAVAALDGVVSVFIGENDTSINKVIQNVTLLPHSIAVVVQGGPASQIIGDTIFSKKTPGTGTEGANNLIQIEVPIAGQTISIWYYPVELITLDIVVNITLINPIPNVDAIIRQNIVDFFNGTFDSTLQPIDIADTSFQSRLFIPVNAAGDFNVTLLTQEIQGSGTPQSAIIPDLNQRLVVTTDTIAVNIS